MLVTIFANDKFSMTNRIVDCIINLKNKCASKEEEIRKEYSLSPAEYNGLLSINNNESLKCNQLSKKMDLSVSRGSRVIEKLMKNGYLKQESSKTDRRISIISLTPKGCNAKKKIEKVLNECEAKILKELTKKEVEQTISILNKLELTL